MARTKASLGAKVASVKSSKARCVAAPPPSSSGSSGSSEKSSRSSSGGGNPVCPRETPVWQKPITSFFGSRSHGDDERASSSDCNVGAGTSKIKPRRCVIESDNEDDLTNQESKQKNTVLDESIELEPLTGEKSHKIVEYYHKNGVQQDRNKENGEKTEEIEENSEISDADDVDIENGDHEKQNKKIINKDGAKQIRENSENDDNSDIEMESDETHEQNGVMSKQNITNKQNINNEQTDDEITKQKGKGRGKKTMNKENVNGNIKKRKSTKRDLDEVATGEDDRVTKKVKVLC